MHWITFYPFVDYGYDKDGRARFESNEDIKQSAIRGATTSQTIPGAPVDLNGNNLTAAEVRALLYPDNNGDLQPSQPIITSSPWFGEVSASNQEIQGFISHPSTPLRIEQLKPAIKLSTCLDMVFELAGDDVTYEAPFLEMQKDVFVLPNLDGREGVIGATRNVDDGFILTEDNVAGVNIDKLSTATTDTTDLLQYTFGDGTVTQTFGKSDNIDDGSYIVPNSGTYELEFSGEFTVTNDTLSGAQFATHQAVIFRER